MPNAIAESQANVIDVRDLVPAQRHEKIFGAACRLAGQACMALRSMDQAGARRFDALLHRLTPKLTDFVHGCDGSSSANPGPRKAGPETSSDDTEPQ
jgi:hypothetical protein